MHKVQVQNASLLHVPSTTPVHKLRDPKIVLCIAGTGKSTYINKHLVQGLPKESWAPIFITFSARTTANMAQEQVCR